MKMLLKKISLTLKFKNCQVMSLGRPFYSFGAAAENDLAPNVARTFPLGWSNTSFPVQLRLYDEFDFILMRSLI